MSEKEAIEGGPGSGRRKSSMRDPEVRRKARLDSQWKGHIDRAAKTKKSNAIKTGIASRKANVARSEYIKDLKNLRKKYGGSLMASEQKEAEEELQKQEAITAEGDEVGTDDGEHDDAAQDKELIKKMIAEYVGKDGEEIEEGEAQEMEALAKEAFEAHKEMGASAEEAYERAGHALKLAKHMACKAEAADKGAEEEEEAVEAKAVEACDDAEKKDEKKDQKESDREKSLKDKLLEAQGKIAAMEATMKKEEVEKYVETKLAESKRPRSITKSFREAAGEIKSKEDFDAKWDLFQTGIKNSRVELDWGLLGEKTAVVKESKKTATGKGLDFSNLAEE